jgi:LPS export ABC transporter protein LptC
MIIPIRMNKQNRGLLVFRRWCTVICLVWAGCENNVKDLPSFRKKHNGVEEGKDILIYYSTDAKVKSKLTAPYMLRNQADSQKVEFPKTLHVDFYNDSMRVESQVDARYGKYYESLNKVFLKDCVIVKNILKGDTLNCQELWWDQRLEKFYTDKQVRINKKGGTIIYGKGFEAPQDFSGYTLYQVMGPLAVKGNEVPK